MDPVDPDSDPEHWFYLRKAVLMLLDAKWQEVVLRGRVLPEKGYPHAPGVQLAGPRAGEVCCHQAPPLDPSQPPPAPAFPG